MMMQSFDGFSEHDHAALIGLAHDKTSREQGHVADIASRLSSLQHVLSRRLFAAGSDLQASWDRPTVAYGASYASFDHIDGLSIAFTRSRSQASSIERMMGRGITGNTSAESYRHPLIEVRITPSHFAIELIMSPYAWWDQRNFIGKMQLQRHRETLRHLLHDAAEGAVLGFWRGSDLCDAHITCRQILRGAFLEDWFSTFAPEHDWFRMGMWYEPCEIGCMGAEFVTDAARRTTALSKLYHFIAWTSENNFHSFLKGNRLSVNFSLLTQ